VPLPFEVIQIDSDQPRYPALNIRSGLLESDEEDDYYPTGEDFNRPERHNSAHGSHPYYNNQLHGSGRFNSNRQNMEDTPNYYGDETSEDRYNESGDYYEGGHSPNIWNTGEEFHDRHYRLQASRQQQQQRPKKHTNHNHQYSLTPQHLHQRISSHNTQRTPEDYQPNSDYDETLPTNQRARFHKQNESAHGNAEDSQVTTITPDAAGDVGGGNVEAPPSVVHENSNDGHMNRIYQYEGGHGGHSRRRHNHHRHFRHRGNWHRRIPRNFEKELPIDDLPARQ